MIGEDVWAARSSPSGATIYLRSMPRCTVFTMIHTQPLVVTGFAHMPMEAVCEYFSAHSITRMGRRADHAGLFMLADKLCRRVPTLPGAYVPGGLYTGVNGEVYLHLPTMQVVDEHGAVIIDRTSTFVHLGTMHVDNLIRWLPYNAYLYMLLTSHRFCPPPHAMIAACVVDDVCNGPLLYHGQLLSNAMLATSGLRVGNGGVVNIGQPVDVDQLRALVELTGV